MNILEAIIQCLLVEGFDDKVIGKTTAEYTAALNKYMGDRNTELSSVDAFMQKHNVQPNTNMQRNKPRGGRHTRANNPTNFWGTDEAARDRSIAYGLQKRMGVEVQPVIGRGFDAAVNNFSQFLPSGAPRRDRDDDPKPMDPYEIVAAWKRVFGYIPSDSKWASFK